MDDGTINPITAYPGALRRAVGRARRDAGVAHRRRRGERRARLRRLHTWLLARRSASRRSVAIIGFGLGAITYARHPEGIVEFQTRKSILAQVRRRALKERANELAAEGTLPGAVPPRRGTVVAAGARPGPLLYFRLHPRCAAWSRGTGSRCTARRCWRSSCRASSFVLAWIFLTDTRLRRIGGYASGGPLLLAAGAVAGGLVGLVVPREGLGAAGSAGRLRPRRASRPASPRSRSSSSRCTSSASRAARGWLSTPITWRDGRAPLGLPPRSARSSSSGRRSPTPAPAGSSSTRGSHPAAGPCSSSPAIIVIVWVQWVAAVQGACNELAIGGEGFEHEPEGIPAADAAGAVRASRHGGCRRASGASRGRRRTTRVPATPARGARASRSASPASPRSTMSTSTSGTARWSGSSVRTAPARRRSSTACSGCCGPSRHRRTSTVATSAAPGVQAGPARLRPHVPAPRAVQRHDRARPLPRHRASAQRQRPTCGRTC